MIQNFSDHAANERTFLAWVRTAIAIMAFGFLVARFNLILRISRAVTMTAEVSNLRSRARGFRGGGWLNGRLPQASEDRDRRDNPLHTNRTSHR